MKKFLFVFPLIIIILLIIAPLAAYFLNFPGEFSNLNTDWGSFGSYVGGTVGAVLSGLGFIVLSATLIITIKHNSAERNASEMSLELSKRSYEEQLKHQKNEFNLQLLNSYIEALDKQLSSKSYIEGKCQSEAEFLDKVLEWLKHFVKNNPKSSDVFTLAFCALNELHVRYDNECIVLSSIEKIIINEVDNEVKHHFHSQLSAKINPEKIFWLQMYLCHCSKGYKDKILQNRLFNPTARIIDAFPEQMKKRKDE